MKKIFLFLSILISFFSYGQAEFPEGVQITGGQPTNTTPTYLTTTSPTGVQEKIPSAYIEKTANKISAITGYDTSLYPNEKAAHDALDLKLNISDLPTNLTLYPTTAASDIPGYVKMVTDIHAPDYNTVAVDVSTPAITGTGQLVSQRITDAGVLIGQPGVFNVTIFGNIRRLSGSGTATFYFEVYRRDALGVETLICTSSISNAVVNGTYAEFKASGVWGDGGFSATDRIVIKSYANRIVGGSDPVYQFQFGGSTPVRTLLPVPFSVVDAGYELKANKQNSLAIDGTGTKYPTVDAVNAVLPTTYSKVVYVNATSPTTATIFDIENPPITNNNLLKNDTANLYIGTDASTWVYLTGTGYVTKTISSATSNFNTFGTTNDAGNSKTSHITRSGAMTLTGPLNILNLKIATTPTTSAGSYDILTRNSSTTALEKKLLSDFVQTTGTQSISGKLNLSNINLYSVENPVFSGLTDTGITGNLSGTYFYSVNYYNSLGETETSGDGVIAVVNKQINVTLPISTNPTVIGRRLYRTIANPADQVIKKLVVDIPNNTTTSYIDNVLDSSLGAPVPRVNTTGGQFFDNTDRVGLTSKGSTSFGKSAFLQNTGYADTAFGFGVLSDNTTGYRNVGVGTYALYKNTTGFNNTAIGVHALNYNIGGRNNTAIGFGTLMNNISGNSNISIGEGSLGANLSGGNNVGIGEAALQSNLASNNVAIGFNSAQYTTTGSGNLSLGTESLLLNTDGNFNTSIGQSSLKRSNGWFNTAVGWNAAANATLIGWDNVAIGAQSGLNMSNYGAQNTFIGSQSGISSLGSGSVFLGNQSGYYETGNNKLFIDNAKRTDQADARVKALIYGQFDSNTANQFLTINGALNVTGIATAPTATVGTNTTQIATTAFVQGIRPYKVYTAILTQVGIGSPTAIVLENTIGNIVWSRTVAGGYFATLSGAFTTDKTTVLITNGSSNGTYIHGASVSTSNVNVITSSDSQIDRATIEIRVYN